MVTLTHSTKYASRSPDSTVTLTPDSALTVGNQGTLRNPINQGKVFRIVAFLLISALLVKFIIEFKIQERLRPPKFQYQQVNRKKLIHLGRKNDSFTVTSPNNNSTNLTFPLQSYLDRFQDESGSSPLSSSLLNITDFKWIRNNISLCKENILPSTKLLAVLIHTSRNHFMERQSIRESWASLKNYTNWSVRPIFLIGQPHPDKIIPSSEETNLDEEHQRFGDTITGSFIDSYRNLTYKHMMGYKWILDHCMEAAYVLKTDDDMFIDVINFIDKQEKEEERKDIYCRDFSSSKPIRSEDSKWFVTNEEWPEPNYPFYCSGWGYGITVDWISKLYLMSFQTRYFWVDDVFMGILLDKAKSFFQIEPEIGMINDYTFDNKLYIDMCRNSTGDRGMLRNATRKFGSVVYVSRDDKFGGDMKCLWEKALMDKNII